MEKADELILLGALYNKIKERVSNEKHAEKVFKEKVDTLVTIGSIDREVADSVSRILIPAEQEKYMTELKEKIMDEMKTDRKGFSSEQTSRKVHELINDILSDGVAVEDFRHNVDPCFHSVSRFSTPSC